MAAAKLRILIRQQQVLRRAHSASSTFAGIDGLRRAEDWLVKTNAALLSVEELREELRRTSSNERCVRLLDTISNRLCSIVDAAELCRSVHPCEKMRRAASEAFEIGCDAMDVLNGDREMYAYAANAKNVDSREARALAYEFAAEFERDGIHLPDARRYLVASDRKKCRELESDLLQLEDDMLERRIDQTVLLADNTIAVHRAKKELNASMGILEDPQTSDTILTSSDANTLAHGMKALSDETARRRCFLALQSSALSYKNEAIRTLSELTARRSSLAQNLGFISFTDMILKGPPRPTLNSPDQVAHFLLHMKSQHNNNKLYQPWNIEYEMLKRRAAAAARARAQLQLTASNTVPAIDILRLPRYSISACVRGLAIVANTAFGLQIIESCENVGWATGVRRLQILDQDSNILGIVYLDLELRQGKQYTGASHFTIRCGCDIASKYIDSPRSDRAVSTWGFIHSDHVCRQLPIVALIASFPQGEYTVSQSDLETLFHEWGHALHSILSNTSSQHLSGTRGATDLVEFPSTLLEACAWHSKVLEAIDRCEDTSIPRDPLPVLKAAALADQDVDSIRQLRLAVFDQLVHGNLLLTDTANSSGREYILHPIESALIHTNDLVPLFSQSYTSDLLSLVHLATAPATYYAYPFDRRLAHDLKNSGLFDLHTSPNADIVNFMIAGSLGQLGEIFATLEHESGRRGIVKANSSQQ